MKLLLLFLLSISGDCLAASPAYRCAEGHACLRPHTSSLSQAENEIFRSVSKQVFPDLFRYQRIPVSFCDKEYSQCLSPAVSLYRQPDTGENLLVVGGFSGGRSQIMYLLDPQRQQELIYPVTGALFTGHRVSDAGLEIGYLQCSRYACRPKTQLMDVNHLNRSY
ncbi:hypothetical protein SG34_008115 [Thalassomonas viridans]|uniref:Uncharacterized protein n=1 Tax=Thalassomonas viridans TaxID=137584 RepID=A0AAE9Z501_9GAMM|nr:hypothetical protein [Thalassomonas viridans]WDE06851.1 hypothetical protein SG34_008115 [Thalassomonas viridans]